MKFWLAFISLYVFFLTSCDDFGHRIRKKQNPVREAYVEPHFKSFDSLTIERIDTYFLSFKKNAVFNGNVLIYKEGKVFSRSYGYSNYIDKVPLNDSNIFQLASGSKPITAIVILQLIEENKLKLSDTISHILPKFPYTDVTVEMLLSHRSGLSNYMYITDSLWVSQDIPMCNENLLDSFICKKPAVYYPPNRKFNYCNTNYFLLAAVAEKITGREFGSLVDEKVFQPAHMLHSLIYSGMNMKSIENLAWGSENLRWHILDYYLNGITGDKGVYSCTSDILKLHFALQDTTLLSQESINNMYKPRSKFNRKGGSYGLGWRIIEPRENYPRVIYHLGWWRGYRSYFIRVPEQDIAIVLLSNLARGSFLNKDELLDLVL